MSQPAYNDIYRKLVANPNDAVGIIAYSFYKLSKIEFIEQSIQASGAVPTDEAMKHFYASSTTTATLNGFRMQAEDLAQTFVSTIVGTRVQELEEQNAREFEAKLRAMVPPPPPPPKGFMYGVWQGVAATFIFSLGVGLMIFTLWSIKFGLGNVVDAIYSLRTNSAAQHPEPALTPAPTPPEAPR